MMIKNSVYALESGKEQRSETSKFRNNYSSIFLLNHLHDLANQSIHSDNFTHPSTIVNSSTQKVTKVGEGEDIASPLGTH